MMSDHESSDDNGEQHNMEEDSEPEVVDLDSDDDGEGGGESEDEKPDVKPEEVDSGKKLIHSARPTSEIWTYRVYIESRDFLNRHIW